MLEIKNLGKTYGEGETATHAIGDINFGISEKEFVCVVGPSGCGKTTLLKCMSGLLPATTGQVLLHGEPIEGPPENMALVFQEYSRSLFPWMTVRQNVSFPLSRRKDTEGPVEQAVESVGLTDFLDRYPWELSGGMQQRVAIARALMVRPDVLLMDEPFGALDAQTREVMHDLIRHVYLLEKTTVVFVTHDVEEALYLGQRVVVMAPRPGRIDSIVDVPFGPERHQDLKLSPEFIALKRGILERIRETSGIKTDLDQLEKLTRTTNA